MCGRPNVGLGNVRVSDSGGIHHNADPLAHKYALAQASRVGHGRGAAAQWCRCGGILKRGERTYPYY